MSKVISDRPLAQASIGVLIDQDFSPMEVELGREFTSKESKIDFVELKGSMITAIVPASTVGKLALDYPQAVVNADNKPAMPGELFKIIGKIGASKGVLYLA